MRNGYRGTKIRLPSTPYSERMKAYGYEDTADFKLRMRHLITGAKPFYVRGNNENESNRERPTSA